MITGTNLLKKEGDKNIRTKVANTYLTTSILATTLKHKLLDKVPTRHEKDIDSSMAIPGEQRSFISIEL